MTCFQDLKVHLIVNDRTFSFIEQMLIDSNLVLVFEEVYSVRGH